MREIHEVATDIRKAWKKVNFAAKPYLAAMLELRFATDRYGSESGRSTVIYFLSNASHFRGDEARKLKAELKEIIEITSAPKVLVDSER